MVNTLYTDLPTLKTALGIQDASSDVLLNVALSSACRSIDKFCGGRRFYRDNAPSARIYRPERNVTWDRDGQLMLVDDIADTTGLVVESGTPQGNSWTPITDYETHPDNALAKGEPITGLLRLAWWFGGYGLRLRVTATWGWPAVPENVVQATLIQAARFYRRKDSPEGVLGSADWGAIRVSRLDPDVQALLADFGAPGIA
jgi:hypothetical protein